MLVIFKCLFLTDYCALTLSLLEQTQAAPSACAAVGYDFFKFTFIYLYLFYFVITFIFIRTSIKKAVWWKWSLVNVKCSHTVQLFSENILCLLCRHLKPNLLSWVRLPTNIIYIAQYIYRKYHIFIAYNIVYIYNNINNCSSSI